MAVISGVSGTGRAGNGHDVVMFSVSVRDTASSLGLAMMFFSALFGVLFSIFVVLAESMLALRLQSCTCVVDRSQILEVK